MKKVLETERLILREFNLDDVDFIIELVNNPTWIKYIGDRGVKTLEDAEKYLKSGPLKSYNDFGYGLWAVIEEDSGKLIGMCGLLKRDYLEHPDIGFAMMPEFAGNGFGFESAKATVDFAHNQLKIDVLSAITATYNEKSINLLKKLGFSFDQNIKIPNDSEEVMLFKKPL